MSKREVSDAEIVYFLLVTLRLFDNFSEYYYILEMPQGRTCLSLDEIELLPKLFGSDFEISDVTYQTILPSYKRWVENGRPAGCPW